MSATASQTTAASATAASELSLNETLRVLEVARSLQRDRSTAEQALARQELRQTLKQRLLDAAVITGDQVTEADVDAAIEQYFARLHDYADPPMSLSVMLAHLWVRRFAIVIGAVGAVALWFGARWVMG